jgi:LAO/AO transport system kinase
MMDLEKLVAGIRSKQRAAIAQAVTLVESGKKEDQRHSRNLLKRLASPKSPCLKIGISGTPGVGKSTFISALMREILRVHPHYYIACLTIDPSSPRNGGSILGDQVRMQEIAAHPQVFVRSTPAEGFLGGVGEHTRESMQVLDAAGFDLCLVETVGVGQSETAIDNLVDILVLLQMPHSGDEIQCMKKGLQELADVVVFNKADGILRESAERAKRDFEEMRKLLPLQQGKEPSIHLCSAINGEGIAEIWQALENR